MGTDATAIVEIQLEGQWLPALMPIWPNPLYDPDSEDEEDRTEYTLHPHIVRDYSLFSVLADVRNKSGRGKVTIQTETTPSGHTFEYPYDTDDGNHEPLAYIAEPRGVPDDASEPWRELAEGGGFHDFTWLTLQELLDGPWSQEVTMTGVMLESDYIRYMKTGKTPDYVAGGAGGPGVLVVTEEEYLDGKRGDVTAVKARWKGGTVQHRNGYFGAFLRIMMMLAVNDDYSTIRLLVAFDS